MVNNQQIQELQKKIIANPSDIALHFTLAKIYEEANLLNDAVKIYQQIIRLEPSRYEVFFNLGLILLKLDKIGSAINSISIAIKINPQFHLGFLKLAEIHEKIREFDQSEKYILEALTITQNSQEILNDYGLFLKRTNQYEQSETIFRQLTESYPKVPKYHGNLANVLQKQLKTTEAMEEYNQAIEFEPDYYEAKFSRSLVLLQNGNYIDGWRDYEVRWQLPYFHMRQLDKPLWHGEEIKGKKLLVWAEQGFGDTIQMFRFLKNLQQRNIEIIFECQEELHQLFLENEGFDKLVKLSETLKIDFDVHVPMMSLPYYLNIDKTNIPSSEGYLKISTPDSSISNDTKKKNIGFVWKGNVKYANDINRSLPIEYFNQLAENDHIQLYSLQYGNNADLDKFPHVIDLSGKIQNFYDAAKIIQNLDLIISVDTAMIHLAGALGKQAYLLLPYSPDWRWGLDASESIWYDSVKIFRQKQPGDWASVFDTINILPSTKQQ